ncbi:hypothetical protein EKO23_13720 [Nocardioides guangzhouensis]|uniref:HTH luxR-type domain-containing protein n=1 Tax=Nocardioides guangzhouensis TaxID=2497878 RepID=A0A4Q4ZAW7_9ACTN|nr:LuxR C-terminal-related transcriptional regulator [Nocardioides guangzhouensis]RYP85042.1 hypothetical protein EKO23_13720 [Nocardioides guangzhouensis]
MDAFAGVPRLPRVYVPRASLNRHLDDATDGGITLLVAPVGAGKTLGVAGWLRAAGPADGARWVNADRTWTPARMAALLDAAATPGPDGLRPLVVVDEAHELPSSTLRLLDERLNQVPDDLRLLLLSRWDLPLSRLVPELLGHFTILRGDVLRMDDDECATLIAEHARTSHADVLRAVTTHANGWCAAVVLTSRAVAASPDPLAAAERFARGDASIADRLASEVFATLQPRQRHLLLCVAAEQVVSTDVATHLTHDPLAADVLAGLETTGLLVSRVPADTGVPQARRGDDDPVATRYRIHPLLIEVVRRRIAAGGVDIAQAQSTVRRAVRLDLARGESDAALRRLLHLNQPEEAARLLVDDGLTLLMRGQGSQIAAFGRRWTDEVEKHPEIWFLLALERWLSRDATAAGHWLDRLVVDHAGVGPEDPRSLRLACTRLVRARMGAEPVGSAIGYARRVLMAQMSGTTPQPLTVMLLTELGIAQNWLGDLVEAEINLSTAIAMSRSRGLSGLTALGLSHLAWTVYMQGRESACLTIAQQAVDLMATEDAPRDFVLARALLARELAGMSDLPWPEPGDPAPAQQVLVHEGDPVTRFWVGVRNARLALAGGSVAEAEKRLQVPTDLFTMSDHLRVVLIIERGFLASLAGDERTLRTLEGELEALGLRGEVALLAGLRLELTGSRKASAAAYAVAEEEVIYSQPATRALAMACRAQLLDVLGEPDQALELLREAATITEVRRNAVPFLGWSRQGTPIESLLARLAQRYPTAWIRELAEAGGGKPDVATVFAPTTPTDQERAKASPDGTPLPALSPREREVLNELARGATYADIAAHLFVSENTIKTHVSNLYGKLVVTRRSEALAVARSLHLL